jgi:hypothetical protein
LAKIGENRAKNGKNWLKIAKICLKSEQTIANIEIFSTIMTIQKKKKRQQKKKQRSHISLNNAPIIKIKPPKQPHWAPLSIDTTATQPLPLVSPPR